MSKAKAIEEAIADENVIVVNDVRQLPYIHIPYSSVAHARVKHPHDTLYHFVSEKKQGWQIIAYPIMMEKPKEQEEAHVQDVAAQV